MEKNTSAAAGFLGSLLLLIFALIVCFVVLYPTKSPPVAPAQPTPRQVAVETKRQAMRKAEPEAVTINPRTAAPVVSEQPVDNRAAAEAHGETDPDYDPDVEKAIGLIDSGSTEEALSVLEQALKKNPNNEQALVELAMIHLLDLKQPEQATGYLQRVVEINPQNQIVLSELVSLYEEQGKLNEGLNFMTDVFAKNPESPDLSYGIGQLLSLQGRDSDAIGYFQKATESDANSIRAYRDLGEAYSRSGDPVKAIESYDKAIEHEQREVDDKAARGLPTQFAEERMNYTKMAKASELIRMGDLDRAQQLIDEVSRTMAGDEAVISLQDTLNKKRAG